MKNKIKSTNSKTLVQNLANCVIQRKKLRTYVKFKTVLKFESYLDSVTDFTIRRNLTQFRLGVHDLEMEEADIAANLYPLKKDIVSYVSI